MNTLHRPCTHPVETVVQRFARAQRLADTWAITCIEESCYPPTKCSTGTWWDTTQMLDPRRNPPEHIDLNADALAHALDRRLIVVDSLRPQWVRVVRHAETPPRFTQEA